MVTSSRTPLEGRTRRHERWARDAMDGAAHLTSVAASDGEVVWSRCLDADINPVTVLAHRMGDGGKEADHQGEHEVTVKTIAQGRPEALR